MENTKQEQAQNLYLMGGLTQDQIAELIGVSQKTISVWFNEGKWLQLKKLINETPVSLLAQMTNELTMLNASIEARDPEHRLPTISEVELRHKILTSMKLIKEAQSSGTHSEILTNFIYYVRKSNPDDARIVSKYTFLYLTGRINADKKKKHDPYLPIIGPTDGNAETD